MRSCRVVSPFHSSSLRCSGALLADSFVTIFDSFGITIEVLHEYAVSITEAK